MAQYHSELNAISVPVVDSDLVWVERSNAPYKATALQLKNYMGVITDHGGLSGLADDDHTQYSLVTGARAFTGKVTLVAGASGAASLNMPAGSAPSSPADGDFWATTASLIGRINGATRTFWHDGNDGAASGLDADLLDSYNSSLTAAVNTVAVRDASGFLKASDFYVGSGNVSLRSYGLNLERLDSAARGIKWYANSYNTWQSYMGPANTAGQGAEANLTTPAGTYVTSWALRSFIEDSAAYGWTWEVGTGSSDTTPTIVAELDSAGMFFAARLHLKAGASDEIARFEGTGNPYISLYDSGSRIGYLQADSANAIYLAADGNKSVNLYTNSVTRVTVTGDGYMNYAAAGGTAYEVGWRDLPQNIQNATYSFVLADRGRSVGKDNSTAYTYTIPANSSVAFPVGSVITVFNHNATSNITIAITTDTLRLAGTTTTGSRTLAPYGFCTLFKVSSTVWLAGGPGLT